MQTKKRGRPRKVINHLAAVPSDISASPFNEKDRETISCRKIENGYLISRSGVKDGKYFDKEFYSPKAPNFNVPKGK